MQNVCVAERTSLFYFLLPNTPVGQRGSDGDCTQPRGSDATRPPPRRVPPPPVGSGRRATAQDEVRSKQWRTGELKRQETGWVSSILQISPRLEILDLLGGQGRGHIFHRRHRGRRRRRRRGAAANVTARGVDVA